MMRVYQLTNGMMAGDAVSNHVLEIDARLRAWGHSSQIFAGYIAPEMEGRVQPDAQCALLPAQADSLLIYHYSIYNPNYRLFARARGKRILVYHNITPARYFSGWDTRQEMQCMLGREALKDLVAVADLSLGDSGYNRQELVEAGASPEKTGVLPIFLSNFDARPADTDLLHRLRQGSAANWLTVGRVVPGKGLHDLIRLFAVYARAINPDSRLYIVGSMGIPAYADALVKLAHSLGVADRVIFAGRVSDAHLTAYYQAADLYVVASYHEGFCVPAVESMHFGLPVLGRKAAALPETLGDAGVLFTRLGYESVAEIAHLLIADRDIRAQVIRKQRERLQALNPHQTESALRAILNRVGLQNGR